MHPGYCPKDWSNAADAQRAELIAQLLHRFNMRKRYLPRSITDEVILEPLIYLHREPSSPAVYQPGGPGAEGFWLYAGSRQQFPVAVWLRCRRPQNMMCIVAFWVRCS